MSIGYGGWTMRSPIAFLILAIAMISGATLAADSLPAAPVPARYQADHTWPKRPLPNNWAIGGIAGFYVDARDHVWVSH